MTARTSRGAVVRARVDSRWHSIALRQTDRKRGFFGEAPRLPRGSRTGRITAGAAFAAVGLGLALLPALKPPAFYVSFLYLVFHWVALATSWTILSGYSGYFSFGLGAFFVAGMYTTAALAAGWGVPVLVTLPLA